MVLRGDLTEYVLCELRNLPCDMHIFQAVWSVTTQGLTYGSACTPGLQPASAALSCSAALKQCFEVLKRV